MEPGQAEAHSPLRVLAAGEIVCSGIINRIYAQLNMFRRVRCRVNSEALSTGAKFVDLPGCQDSNIARGKMAEEYKKNADAFWIG
jgi:hypothetical protein